MTADPCTPACSVRGPGTWGRRASRSPRPPANAHGGTLRSILLSSCESRRSLEDGAVQAVERFPRSFGAARQDSAKHSRCEACRDLQTPRSRYRTFLAVNPVHRPTLRARLWYINIFVC